MAHALNPSMHYSIAYPEVHPQRTPLPVPSCVPILVLQHAWAEHFSCSSRFAHGWQLVQACCSDKHPEQHCQSEHRLNRPSGRRSCCSLTCTNSWCPVLQAYGRHVLYKRDSLAVLSAIDDADGRRSALDDEDSWPGWMSSKALWLFPPDHPWRRDIKAVIARQEYAIVGGIVVVLSILGVFLTPQAQLVPVADTKVCCAAA